MNRLKLKSASSIFSRLYLIVGVALAIVLIQSDFTLFHVGLLAALNLITSYGLNQKERWAVYLAAWLSLIGIVFGYTVIYAVLQLPIQGLIQTILLLGMALYITFSVISLFYITIKRDKFK